MGTQNTVKAFFYPDTRANDSTIIFMGFCNNRLFLLFALVNLQLAKTTLQRTHLCNIHPNIYFITSKINLTHINPIYTSNNIYHNIIT